MNSDYAVAPESCLGAWYALAHLNLVRFKKKNLLCGGTQYRKGERKNSLANGH